MRSVPGLPRQLATAMASPPSQPACLPCARTARRPAALPATPPRVTSCRRQTASISPNRPAGRPAATASPPTVACRGLLAAALAREAAAAVQLSSRHARREARSRWWPWRWRQWSLCAGGGSRWQKRRSSRGRGSRLPVATWPPSGVQRGASTTASPCQKPCPQLPPAAPGSAPRQGAGRSTWRPRRGPWPRRSCITSSGCTSWRRTTTWCTCPRPASQVRQLAGVRERDSGRCCLQAEGGRSAARGPCEHGSLLPPPVHLPPADAPSPCSRAAPRPPAWPPSCCRPGQRHPHGHAPLPAAALAHTAAPRGRQIHPRPRCPRRAPPRAYGQRPPRTQRMTRQALRRSRPSNPRRADANDAPEFLPKPLPSAPIAAYLSMQRDRPRLLAPSRPSRS